MSNTARYITDECNAIMNLLLDKNAKYGDAALNPLRLFSSAEPDELIRVRIDDKLSRLKNNTGAEDEDVVLDLIGYLILLRVYKRMKVSMADQAIDAN